MSKLVNVLELSLANTGAPELSDQRRKEILLLRNPAKKFGAYALHEFTNRYPGITARLIGRDIAKAGVIYVAAGSESVVYRRDHEVVKVNQRTLYVNEAEKRRVATEKTYEHAIMRRYLAGFMIDQSIDVAAHPVVGSLRAVCITQPFCNITDLNIFPPHDPNVNMEALVEARRKYPGIEDALRGFGNAALTMYHESGMVPDTSGQSNVVVHNTVTPELLIIDGQPVSPAYAPQSHANIIQQLHALNNALS